MLDFSDLRFLKSSEEITLYLKPSMQDKQEITCEVRTDLVKDQNFLAQHNAIGSSMILLRALVIMVLLCFLFAVVVLPIC